MRLHTRCRMSAEREREIRASASALSGWQNDMLCELLRELDATRDELRMTRLHMTERLRDRQTECQALHARAMRAEAKAKEGGG